MGGESAGMCLAIRGADFHANTKMEVQVVHPLGSAEMKLWALADAAAASISASVAPGFPYAMLALMVVANSVGSWLTMPICAPQ